MLGSFQDGIDFLILRGGTCLVNALLDIPLVMASMALANRISRGIEWACAIMETKVSEPSWLKPLEICTRTSTG